MKSHHFCVPQSIRCSAGEEPRNKIKMGVLTTRGLVHSAQELNLDPKDRGEPMQGVRKQPNEQLSNFKSSLSCHLGEQSGGQKTCLKSCVVVQKDEMRTRTTTVAMGMGIQSQRKEARCGSSRRGKSQHD